MADILLPDDASITITENVTINVNPQVIPAITIDDVPEEIKKLIIENDQTTVEKNRIDQLKNIFINFAMVCFALVLLTAMIVLGYTEFTNSELIIPVWLYSFLGLIKEVFLTIAELLK